MRFLFTTLQFQESDFYGRVGSELQRRGHEVAHVAYSRRSARTLRRRGFPAWCLRDELNGPGGLDVTAETARLETSYATPSLRDVYRTDAACAGRPEDWCVARTVRHFLAAERILDDSRPDIIVPEVGSETMRTVFHLVGLRRAITVLFLFYTIFPEPLRLYANTMHAPIVAPEELRELDTGERVEVERFIAEFTARERPIRAYREPRVNAGTLRDFARHIAVSLTSDRDNEYLRPARFVTGYARERARAALSAHLYEPPDDGRGRPFVYFPLHVTDDYKIKRLIPHCVHQVALIEQVAEALPQGIDLVLKEHPMSRGRNPVGMLRRLARRPNVRLVDPYTSSHELIRRAEAVVVISSTVGLEALLYGRPVLTLGQPFYAGAGVTLDVDSFRELGAGVAEVLAFRPDRERILRFLAACMRSCRAGVPGGVDDSQANARRLATALDDASRQRGSATAVESAARGAAPALVSM